MITDWFTSMSNALALRLIQVRYDCSPINTFQMFLVLRWIHTTLNRVAWCTPELNRNACASKYKQCHGIFQMVLRDVCWYIVCN